MNQIEWFFEEFKGRKQVTTKEIECFFYDNTRFTNNPGNYYHFSRFLRMFLKELSTSKNAQKVYEIDWGIVKEHHPDLFKEKKPDLPKELKGKEKRPLIIIKEVV